MTQLVVWPEIYFDQTIESLSPTLELKAACFKSKEYADYTFMHVTDAVSGKFYAHAYIKKHQSGTRKEKQIMLDLVNARRPAQ